jgi:uncharacterized protein YkwD
MPWTSKRPLVILGSAAALLGASACQVGVTPTPGSGDSLVGESPSLRAETASPAASGYQVGQIPSPLRTYSPGLSRERDSVRVRPRYPNVWLLRHRWDTAAEEEIKRLVDQARALAGNYSALQRNNALSAVARAHSMEMAGRQTASPVKADGTGVADWVRAAGLPFAEVDVSVHRVAKGLYAAHDTVRDRLDGWLNQPGDRARLLKADFYDTGVGVFPASDGYLYITMIVRRPTFGP